MVVIWYEIFRYLVDSKFSRYLVVVTLYYANRVVFKALRNGDERIHRKISIFNMVMINCIRYMNSKIQAVKMNKVDYIHHSTIHMLRFLVTTSQRESEFMTCELCHTVINSGCEIAWIYVYICSLCYIKNGNKKDKITKNVTLEVTRRNKKEQSAFVLHKDCTSK